MSSFDDELRKQSHEGARGAAPLQQIAYDVLISRIEALEEFRREVGSWAPKIRKATVAGLERSYAKVIKDKLDPDDARDAADVVRHFFRHLTHDDRVRILLSAGMIAVANNTIYYNEAFDTMKKADREKVAKLYGFMYRLWSEHEALVIGGATITCYCGEVVNIPEFRVENYVQFINKHNLNVKKVDGNAELFCLGCGNHLCVWDGYCWVAYRPGWGVKLDGLVKRKDFVVENEHVCELCERITGTKQRWNCRWLCDWCNKSEQERKLKEAIDCPLSEEQVESILGWIDGAERVRPFDCDDTGKHRILNRQLPRRVCLPEPLALALVQHLRGLYGSR